MTLGMARPANAGQFAVDEITLQQVAAAINANPRGLRSRMTHPELTDEDGIGRLVGKIANARVVGQKVVADFRFGSYADPEDRRRIMGLAKEAPEDVGLSVVINAGRLENVGGSDVPAGRIDSLFAVDWVGEAGANPNGLLAANPQTRTPTMFNERQMAYLFGLGLPEDADDQAIHAFVADLDETQMTTLTGFAGDAAAAPEGDPAPAEPAADVPAVAADPTATPAPKAPDAAPVTPEEPAAASSTPAIAASAGRSMTDDQIRQIANNAVAADRDRQAGIRDVARRSGLDEKWALSQINAGVTLQQARGAAFNAITGDNGPVALSGSGISVGDDLNRSSLGQAVSDAILLRANAHHAFIQFDGEGRPVLSERDPATGRRSTKARKPHARTSEFQHLSMIEMGRRYLTALGYRDADRLSRPALAKLLMSRTALHRALSGVYLAHADGDFPNILADDLGKSMRAAYALAAPTYRSWAATTTAPDFKDIKKLQLSEAADLAAINPGGEYTYGTLTETKETYALAKYGKGLKFTREMLINDDLSAFDRVPRLMGNAAARLEETTAIAILTANAALQDGVALFHASHSNLTTGVLSVTSLGAARALMRKQTSEGSSDPLELMPSILLVPEDLATTAEQLIGSAVDPALANAAINPFNSRLQVVSSARLSTDSTAQWYMFANPSEIDTVEVAFLEGEESPTVEEEDEFDTDVRKLKIRHHIAAKALDYRGMVRSSGV